MKPGPACCTSTENYRNEQVFLLADWAALFIKTWGSGSACHFGVLNEI